MKNLKSIIQYECLTSLKYLLIFYPIQYGVIVLISLIIGMSTGSCENIGTDAIEMNSLIYVGVLGVLGLTQDFKMLIQNGFTRTYIFTATLSMFCFISGTMAIIDTAVGNLLHHFNHHYSSLYGGLYGYENLFMNLVWLFLVYVSVCSLLYFIILIIHKLGKNGSVYLGCFVGGILLLVIALFRYVFSIEATTNVLAFLAKAMGFIPDGTINYLFPVFTFLSFIAILGSGSYAIIRRTELK